MKHPYRPASEFTHDASGQVGMHYDMVQHGPGIGAAFSF